MINKTLAFLVTPLIILVALITALNFSSETDSDTSTIIEGDNTFDNEDLVNEIDETLLDEDGEVDIGEML